MSALDRMTCGRDDTEEEFERLVARAYHEKGLDWLRRWAVYCQERIDRGDLDHPHRFVLKGLLNPAWADEMTDEGEPPVDLRPRDEQAEINRDTCEPRRLYRQLAYWIGIGQSYATCMKSRYARTVRAGLDAVLRELDNANLSPEDRPRGLAVLAHQVITAIDASQDGDKVRYPLKTMASTMSRIGQVLEDHFPGYREYGMMRLVFMGQEQTPREPQLPPVDQCIRPMVAVEEEGPTVIDEHACD